MKLVGVNAIATLIGVNDKGEFSLDVQSSKSMTVGKLTIEQGKELPGYNDRI